MFWLRAIVELCDNIATARNFTNFEDVHILHNVNIKITFLKQMLCYVRDVTNNIMSHLIFYLEAKKSLLTQFVREYWDAAKRGSEINWRQAPTSSHVFLGLFYLLMSHVIMSVSKCFKFDKPTIIVYLRT